MPDRVLKLTAKLPQGDANGLAAPDVIGRVIDDPSQLRIGIVIFKVNKIERDTDTGDEVGKAGIERIEVILDDSKGDASALQRLLMRAYERRTGATTLDAELEEDVRAAFDAINIIDMADGDDPRGGGARFGNDSDNG
jgi:hypothetical protein